MIGLVIGSVKQFHSINLHQKKKNIIKSRQIDVHTEDESSLKKGKKGLKL